MSFDEFGAGAGDDLFLAADGLCMCLFLPSSTIAKDIFISKAETGMTSTRRLCPAGRLVDTVKTLS